MNSLTIHILILVRCNNKVVYRKSHELSIASSQNISKIASWH